MFAMGLPELLLFPVLALLVLYVVIRLAVKHGSLDAGRVREADEERRRLARAVEKSRNSGL
jgi:hypothetical protein